VKEDIKTLGVEDWREAVLAIVQEIGGEVYFYDGKNS